MDFIEHYIPTSKAQLIQVSMWYCKGDMQKAQEMVDFYTKNMDLPDFDPAPPTFMTQVKSNASDFFSFIKQNQGDIIKGYEFIRSIIANKGMLPSIDEDPVTAEPLPPIN